MYLLPAMARRGRQMGILVPAANYRVAPITAAARRRGLGVIPQLPSRNGGSPAPCPAWGCGGPRRQPWGRASQQQAAAAGTTTTTSSAPATTTAPAATANAGTPVPAGFPTNQLFINTDGSQWMYSAATASWQDVGTPYNVSGAAAVTPTSASAASPASAGVAPAAVAAAPVDSSGYQPVLDWLSQSSLIGGVPNWAMALGAGLLVVHMMRPASAPAGRR